MAIVDNAFREWIADFKAINPGFAESRQIIDTAQYAFAAGRKAQREVYLAQPSPATCKEALQVQPFPGGQGDAHRQWLEVRGLAAGIVKNLRAFAESPHKAAWCGALDDALSFAETIEKDADAAYEAALAARQPVGEPNFAACCAEGGGSVAGCSCVNPNHVFLASQASLTAEERAHGETIDQRDRCEEVADELADHIARITGVDIGEHSSANCPWQNAIEAAEEYKPAQAVDLSSVRALLQRRIEQWRSYLPADPDAPGTREIETKGERDYNNDVRIYREGIAVMEEVLSKIDGQAVVNG